jgi:hypothetical protein
MSIELNNDKERYLDIINQSFKSNFRNYNDVINAIAGDIHLKEKYIDFTSIEYLIKEGFISKINKFEDIMERKICTEN